MKPSPILSVCWLPVVFVLLLANGVKDAAVGFAMIAPFVAGLAWLESRRRGRS